MTTAITKEASDYPGGGIFEIVVYREWNIGLFYQANPRSGTHCEDTSRLTNSPYWRLLIPGHSDTRRPLERKASYLSTYPVVMTLLYQVPMGSRTNMARGRGTSP